MLSFLSDNVKYRFQSHLLQQYLVHFTMVMLSFLSHNVKYRFQTLFVDCCAVS